MHSQYLINSILRNVMSTNGKDLHSTQCTSLENANISDNLEAIGVQQALKVTAKNILTCSSQTWSSLRPEFQTTDSPAEQMPETR